MTITRAALLCCVLLFTGHHAAASKSFGGGGHGDVPLANKPEPANGGALTTPTPEAGGETVPASYSTPEAAAVTTPTPEAGGEAAPASDSTPAAPSEGGEVPAAPSGGDAKAGMDPDGEPEVGLNKKAIDNILNEHNLFRAKENKGLQPLVWNETLAKFSQQYAETLRGECKSVHSTSPYGENLMQGTGAITWRTTVDQWSEEKKSYHYDTNTCDPGQMCGHYIAVVWKSTTSVGCGRVKCNNGGTMEMCSYWPPGFVIGEKPF